ncbi:hypothetical protein V8B97DRAFT_1920862 [Scleroderma yunnanense]
MSKPMFNTSSRMVNIHVFSWLKDYTQGTIMLENMLDTIKWMDLMFHMVMDPGCWLDIEAYFMQELRIMEPDLHTVPPNVSITLGSQELGIERSPSAYDLTCIVRPKRSNQVNLTETEKKDDVHHQVDQTAS